MGYTCHSFEYLGKANGTMSKQMEELLEKLTNEKNILLGIHRIKEYTTQEAIDDILANGLKMTGHFDGSIPTSRELQNSVSYYVDNKIVIKELMYTNQFKNSKGSILIRIPDEELTKNIYIRSWFFRGPGELYTIPVFPVMLRLFRLYRNRIHRSKQGAPAHPGRQG